MTPAETTTILRQFNEWRRDTSNWPPSPMLIEKAIDAAIEMIERLEAAEKSDAESLAMYRKARDERDALRLAVRHEADCVEAAKAEVAALRAELAGLRSSMGFRTSLIGRTEVERDALRARFETMEKQEPVAWLHESRRDSDVVTSAVKHVWGKVAVGSLAAYSIPLYLAPGAKGE